MSYVTLRVMNDVSNVVEMEMEGEKTIKYAAKVVAEHLGAEGDDADWRLLDASTHTRIPEDDIAANWGGREVVLVAAEYYSGRAPGEAL